MLYLIIIIYLINSKFKVIISKKKSKNYFKKKLKKKFNFSLSKQLI